MKLFIITVLVIIISFGIVYNFSKGSPRPNKYALKYGLEKHLDFTPIQWDCDFGKEIIRPDGIPAWPVTYNITTSSVGKDSEIMTLKILFYKVGYDWKTEKI